MDSSNNARVDPALTRLIRNFDLYAGGTAYFLQWLANSEPETYAKLAQAYENYLKPEP